MARGRPILQGIGPGAGLRNVLFLTYAEMKADHTGTVRRIAALMDVELSDAVLALVVEKSSFAYMKRLDHAVYARRAVPFDRLLGKPSMIRKGEAGGTAELLTAEKQKQIDDFMQSELRRYQCDFPYAEVFENTAWWSNADESKCWSP